MIKIEKPDPISDEEIVMAVHGWVTTGSRRRK